MKLHSPEVVDDNDIYHGKDNPASNLLVENESQRSSASTLAQHNAMKTLNVHFSKCVYDAEEEYTNESYIAAAFRGTFKNSQSWIGNQVESCCIFRLTLLLYARETQASL